MPQTALAAETFDFPLDPAHFGPYQPYVSGSLPVDTRFGVQNPGVGSAGKCFVDAKGQKVPFDQLYHAGEDWFALDAASQVDGRAGRGAEVHAVANGVVTWTEGLGSEGALVVVEHTLPDGALVWSAYWHLSDVTVAAGQAVRLGERLGQIHDRGYNSHLHWEIRTFGDGSALFPAAAAGGRGTCNGHIAAVGYTWDDDPARARPEAWGYLAPGEFIRAHQTTP